MPIYEETYRSWDGHLEERPHTWWVIARTGVKLLWKRSMFFLLFVAYIPFFVRAVQIYLMTRLGGLGDQTQIVQAVERFRVNPKFFSDFLQGQHFFLLLILILVGAGLIANDRRFRALSIYFSKPVSFWDYVLGKWLVVGFYASLVTLVPGLLLFLLRVLLASDAAFFQTYYWIPFSVVGYVALSLVALGGIVLALSAGAKGTRSAAIAFFAFIMFPEAFRQFLYRVPEVGLLSVSADIRQAGSLLFGLEKPFAFSTGLAWVVLTAFILLSYAVLKWKVRPTEVVR